MPPFFPPSANNYARTSIIFLIVAISALGLTAYKLQSSPWVTREGIRPEQPVPFSHQHHVSGLGIDCRFCHTSVETSGFAGIPPTKTCMNCHSMIWTNAPLLEPVRASFKDDKSLVWTRVHDLPDYVYFSHEIHINKGIGCKSCHGPIDEMPLTYMNVSLQMEWCLDCHRNPEPNLRPVEEVTNMTWTQPSPEFGKEFREKNHIAPPTDCSTCHR